MKEICYFIITVLLVFGVTACSAKNDKDTSSSNPTQEADSNNGDETSAVDSNTKGSVVTENIKSEAIAKNIIGDTDTRTIYIYLPPSYNSSKKKYPVVYFLHGYGDSCQDFMKTYQSKLDDEFKKGAKEFILVALDGNNKTGGSFYVNSPVIGNWEDFVVNEVVSYVDKNYRTIAESTSRGISGYSMGGFGALYLSLRHPDIYSSSLLFCPGVFVEDDLDSVMASWAGWIDVKKSYAQAFSPNEENKTDYGNILTDSDITAKNKVWEDWMNGYSNWGTKLDQYLALKKPLKSIMINYSIADSFSWIPGGCEYLVDLFEEKKINYFVNKFNGGHIVPQDAMGSYFVPFFGENLEY